MSLLRALSGIYKRFTMDWNSVLLSVTGAISEYRKRGEPIPGELKKTEEWVRAKTNFSGNSKVEEDDLSQLFLRMVGWSH